MFRVAGFVEQKHKSPLKRGIKNLMLWIVGGPQRSEALDFIDDDSSIDHLDYEGVDRLVLNLMARGFLDRSSDAGCLPKAAG